TPMLKQLLVEFPTTLDDTKTFDFGDCMSISSISVLQLLEKDNNSAGTYVYLVLLHLLIRSFVNKSIIIADRVHFSWVVVFLFDFGNIGWLELRINQLNRHL
ncbi:unnamed protein product, partial [Didymodactylos carnosus]